MTAEQAAICLSLQVKCARSHDVHKALIFSYPENQTAPGLSNFPSQHCDLGRPRCCFVCSVDLRCVLDCSHLQPCEALAGSLPQKKYEATALPVPYYCRGGLRYRGWGRTSQQAQASHSVPQGYLEIFHFLVPVIPKTLRNS